MNIVFWFLIVVALFILWLLLSPVFKDVGEWFLDLFNGAKREIEDDESDEYYEECEDDSSNER